MARCPQARFRRLPLGVAFCFFAACLLALPSLAQMDMNAHTMETKDEIPPDQLPVPQKMTGVGTVHLAITATPEAQIWFDQGLNLIQDFWDYESARAFEQSVRVDPQCAMCYWGLYKAESFYHGTQQGYAAQALAKAVGLERLASKPERLYIEATAASAAARNRPGASADPSPEVRLWRKLVKRYPQNTQGRIFLALALEDGFDAGGEPRAGQKEALALLQSVLKEDPRNSAANHYYIHAVEASAHPEWGLASAAILADLAPASGHIVHMPGHIYFRAGDYAAAERSFAASMEVDERYMREQHVAPDDNWNYVHNLMYAVANLLEEGKLSQATALSAKLGGARGELESTLYIYQPRDSISRVDARLPVALRTADWRQVLELSKAAVVPQAWPNLRFLAGALADFAAGMQALASGNLAAAEDASTRFDAGLWRASQDRPASPPMAAMPAVTANNAPAGPPKLSVRADALLGPLVDTLSVMSLELRGSLLAARGQAGEAKRAFAQAAREEKDLGYREPPAYIRPVAETEAAAWMAAGDWAAARSAFQAALAERPRSGFALYGMALCNEKAGDSAAAAAAYSDFLTAWKSADPALPQLGHARAYLAEHPAVAAVPATRHVSALPPG